MAELQVGIRDIAIELDRFSVGIFSLQTIAGLLESVPILNPNRGMVWLFFKRLSVISSCRLPVA